MRRSTLGLLVQQRTLDPLVWRSRGGLWAHLEPPTLLGADPSGRFKSVQVEPTVVVAAHGEAARWSRRFRHSMGGILQRGLERTCLGHALPGPTKISSSSMPS